MKVQKLREQLDNQINYQLNNQNQNQWYRDGYINNQFWHRIFSTKQFNCKLCNLCYSLLEDRLFFIVKKVKVW